MAIEERANIQMQPTRRLALVGARGVHLIKGLHDEALAGKWRRFRSSRLGDQWRVIDQVDTDRLTYYVESITAHDYRRQ